MNTRTIGIVVAVIVVILIIAWFIGLFGGGDVDTTAPDAAPPATEGPATTPQ
jgi:hypothetical protein